MADQDRCRWTAAGAHPPFPREADCRRLRPRQGDRHQIRGQPRGGRGGGADGRSGTGGALIGAARSQIDLALIVKNAHDPVHLGLVDLHGHERPTPTDAVGIILGVAVAETRIHQGSREAAHSSAGTCPDQGRNEPPGSHHRPEAWNRNCTEPSQETCSGARNRACGGRRRGKFRRVLVPLERMRRMMRIGIVEIVGDQADPEIRDLGRLQPLNGPGSFVVGVEKAVTLRSGMGALPAFNLLLG
ncbi:hypothetical protein ACFQY9_08785 [Microvirga aerilata]|uniref:hypothetical protein n=1 Tax=Microvirga aerilata TaxID=670292 RepID=UPI003644F64F